MENHVCGRPTPIGELRHALAGLFFGNPLFLAEEQLLANHYIHECEDAQQLSCWLTNTIVALGHRAPTSFSVTSYLPENVV